MSVVIAGVLQFVLVWYDVVRVIYDGYFGYLVLLVCLLLVRVGELCGDVGF